MTYYYATLGRIQQAIAKQTSICSQQQTIPATTIASSNLSNPSNATQSVSLIITSSNLSNQSNSTQSVFPTTSSTTLPNNVNINDSQTPNEQIVTIEGSRIINIEKLSNYINDITIHSSKCGGNIILTGEKRYGLASVISSRCNQCAYEIVLESSRKVEGPSECKRWECNLATAYNAKSGVGIIIGHATGKVLYVGVRIKYCSTCSQGIPQDRHKCYKNWDDSSSEMESGIILEGFKQAESTHGVRYMRFIGDGDSSVYPTLIQHVPLWGRFIKKIECANHACKCFRASLEKLVADNPSYKGKSK